MVLCCVKVEAIEKREVQRSPPTVDSKGEKNDLKGKKNFVKEFCQRILSKNFVKGKVYNDRNRKVNKSRQRELDLTQLNSQKSTINDVALGGLCCSMSDKSAGCYGPCTAMSRWSNTILSTR